MVELIPPPKPHTLLPPFLACLPTALASSTPPPAFLPQLSPILRQRIQFNTSSTLPQSESWSWLPLLCWDKEKAARVKTIVEEGTWEPHPISGEIEVGEEGPLIYKRFDKETLRAQIPLPDWDLTVVYLWCSSEEGRGEWLVAEVLPYDSNTTSNPTWFPSVSEANLMSSDRMSLYQTLNEPESPQFQRTSMISEGYSNYSSRNPSLASPGAANPQAQRFSSISEANPHSSNRVSEASHDAGTLQDRNPSTRTEATDDDDDYWAQYDQTPARSPTVKRSPGPETSRSTSRPGAQSEDDYYARYGSVQPALDAADPSEAEDSKETDQESTLNGNTFSHLLQPRRSDPAPTNGYHVPNGNENDAVLIPEPSRSRSSTAGSDAVARLEQEAEDQSSSDIGVRQHISTSIKSMYRLAKSAGMGRDEFATLVARELEVLEMMD